MLVSGFNCRGEAGMQVFPQHLHMTHSSTAGIMDAVRFMDAVRVMDAGQIQVKGF
jgi:hypothetical protein